MGEHGSRDWDLIGFVISSQYRVAVVRHLAEGPATPSRIAAEEGYRVAHVSKALSALRDRSVVELLVPEERTKGRIYGLTPKGERTWERINDQKIA
jgi:DNA-binding transcriptional ArsR family regulator